MESSQTLRLEGGRTLGYAEWGATSGYPLLHFHGSGSSRLERPVQPEALAAVRLVTIDRPGHGLSGFQPNRTLLDWPEDVAALANHLGIERFAVSGWSAGGPYALVCAYRIPQRLTAVGLISSLGPQDRPVATEGMDRFNRMTLAVTRRLPWAVNRQLRHHRDRPIPADVLAFASDVTNEVHWRTGVTEAGFTAESPLRVGPDVAAPASGWSPTSNRPPRPYSAAHLQHSARLAPVN